MFKINGRRISREDPPYIIAELSANHGGSIDKAKFAIKCAKDAGASAVKIQSYTPDTMTIDCDKPDFQIKDGLWKGSSLYALYADAHTPYEWHKELFDYADETGITLFSTPFDESAVELLESLKTPAYKIASFELTDIPLIKIVGSCKKPIFMSTGMGTLEEIGEALEAAKSAGSNDILLFHCISSYPAPTDQSNLASLQTLAKEFGTEVGLSDHSLTNIASTVAIGLGACAIEKHFKADDSDSGPDSSFSLTPEQLKSLVDDCGQAWLSIGREGFERSAAEKSSKDFRRSIYFMKDLAVGDVIKDTDIRCIRPGFGLPPKYFDEIVGKKLAKNVERGDPVQLNCFDTS
jgi:N-acetylneuraminate synthase